MKKMLTLMLAAAMVLSLAACGNSSGGGKEPDVDYDTEFDSIMERIGSMSDTAHYVALFNEALWDEVGPEKVAGCLSEILELERGSDASSSLTQNVLKALGLGSEVAEAWNHMSTYKKSHEILSGGELAALKADVKALKDACGEEHSAGVGALQSYYTKLEAYVDFAVNPSGNLMNYRTNLGTYDTEMGELKSTAEFEK